MKIAISPKLQIESRQNFRSIYFVGGLTLHRLNPIWLPDAILKNGLDVITPPQIVRYYIIWQADANDIPMTTQMSCVEIETGSRIFSETGRSFIPAVD